MNERQLFANPEFYQQKANQLRIQNQLLKRQLGHNLLTSNTKNWSSPSRGTSHTYHQQVPVRQVIYHSVPGLIKPPQYFERHGPFNVSPEKIRIQPYQLYSGREFGNRSDQSVYYEPERKRFISQVEEQIIELQERGYKLEREANKLSSHIKEDLKDFIRDSNVHKECSYKQKYLRAITNRPKYFRLNY